MRIRFSLTRSDLFTARSARLVSSRPLLICLLLIAAFFAAGAFTHESLAGKDALYRAIFASIQILFVVGFTFLAGTVVIAVHCWTTKGNGVLGEHTLAITDEGLLETTPYNSSLNRWSGFHRIKESRRFLWIYVTDTMAHIVPRKRQLLEGDLPAFTTELRKRIGRS